MSSFVASSLAIEAMAIAIGGILPTAQVYADRAPQGIIPGAFVIRQISQVVRGAVGIVDLNDGEITPRRQLRRPTFEVRYYPESDEGERNKECRDVEELLIFALEQVTTREGVLLTAEDMRGVVSDGVLVMTLDYPYIIEDTRYADPMRHMDYDLTNPRLVND